MKFFLKFGKIPHIRAKSVPFFLSCPVQFRALISKFKSTRLKLIYVRFTITNTLVVSSAVQFVICRRLPDFWASWINFPESEVRPQLLRAYVHVVHCVPRCPVAHRPYPGSVIAWFTKSRVRLYCQVMFVYWSSIQMH